jgi:hypothetical protein
MNAIKVFLLLLLFSPQMRAQLNLVPNSSFEDTLNCDSFTYYPNVGYPWFTPTDCTPDYYYGLQPSCGYSALQNPSGFQIPFDGIAYVGIFVAKPPNSYGTREYITSQLLDTLLGGKQYKLQFYVSRANYFGYATDDIGAYFSSQPPSSLNCLNLPLIPQVENPQGNIITDSINWTPISGIYTATGGELFITIGNFKDSINTTYVDADSGNGMSTSAYYYIDMVSLISVDSIIGLNDFSNNNNSITIFPNPVKRGESIKIDINKNEAIKLNLYSVDGKLVKVLETNSEVVEIPTNDLEVGYYVLTIDNFKNRKYFKILIF